MTGGDAEALGGTDVTPRYRQLAAVALALLCIGAGTLGEVPAATAATGQSIVEEAAKWAGTPYCWDGGNQNGPTPGTRDPENGLQCGVGGYEPPGTVGFDCTGLTLYAVYQATGILLPHGKGQESVPGGTPVARSQLQPGDLVFFGPSLANYSHAGVYAGGGKMWDAQNEGVPVQLHSLYSDYVGAERYWHESGPPGEGSFVSHAGFVYRIAGGAPIYVSNWATVGGAQPTTPLSDAQFAALPQYPRDGTFLGASGGGVFVVAGGAPLYVSNWNAVGGPKSVIGVDEAAITNAGGGEPWNHLRPYPADGTILDSSGGGVFIAAGGAPLYLSNWNAIGGPQPGVGIDEWDIANAGNPYSHLNPVPNNGTLISSTATGMVYEIAGGAPLYVSNWAAIGGARSAVAIDQWDLDNITNPAAHLNAVPTNGTLLGASGGGVFIAAGGAPMYLSNWAAIGGPQPVVPIDEWDITNLANPAAHLNAVPANGTFLNTSTGHVYRVAGGAPFAVSSWSVFGGEQPYVTVDEWDVENITNPAAHLNVAPSDGTIVEGLPSNTYWSFAGGLREPLGAGPGGAVTVDDYGLDAYSLKPHPPAAQPPPAQQPPPGPQLVTPPGPHAGPQLQVASQKTKSAPAHLTRKQILARALRRCRRIKNHQARHACEARAHRHSAVHARASSLRPAHLMCFAESGPVARVRPSRCDVFGEPEDDADLIRISSARWTGWGTPTAHATATALANKPAEEQPVSVTITLTGLSRRCHGQLFYTRLLAVETSGSSSWFTPAGRRTLRLSGACHQILVSG